MSVAAILVHPGLGTPGGVSTDVSQLAGGLRKRGVEVALAGSLRDLRRELDALPRGLVCPFGCLPGVLVPAGFGLAKARRRRLIWTPVFHPSRPRSWQGYGALRVMELFDRVAPHAARFADAVIAATEAEAAFFRSLGAKRVERIPPGVWGLPEPADPWRVEAFGRRVGLDDGPVVLMVARDNSRKGLPFGLAAFAALRELLSGAQLLLCGPEPGFHASRQPGMRCPGWLEPDEIGCAYRRADLLFVSSLYEGLPRAVVEAWRYSLPVVASDRIALAPDVAAGRGLVVRYGDAGGAAAALARVLGDPALARRFGEAGRRHVEENFLMEDIVARTESLYRELGQG